MSPLEIHQADLTLEKDIQAILQNKSLRKKEKKRLLRALQDESCNAHLRSHVQYYLDMLQVKTYDILLNLLSTFIISGFFLYTILRLAQVL